MKIYWLIMLAMIAGSCKDPQGQQNKNNSIVLVNAGKVDRTEMASALNKLNKCGPRVVGINFIFTPGNINSADTLLANAITNAGNVVLVMLPGHDDKVIQSDSMFVSGALAQGLLYYGFDDEDVVTKQMMYISVGDDLLWSFPTTLASYYDVERSDEIMKGVAGNTYYTISDNDDKLKVIEINTEFDCSWIKDKIVLIGYLGPSNEDLFMYKGEKKYSTSILADCVDDIVNRRFVKVD